VVAAKKIDMRVELLGAMPQAGVDAARIRQVMHNLLDNALWHTPENGRICVSVEQKGANLSVTVVDSGAGIKPEDLPHLFDRFYRTDNARSRDRGGTGLGLAIVRAIVEAHDGEVTVESAGFGNGSSIAFTLPLGKLQ
jgi:signal transduction histidine kinase